MNYSLEFSATAERYYARVNPVTRARLATALSEIRADPLGSDTSKPLAGLAGLRSARVGALRVIFRVDDELGRIRVIRIGPRGQVYRGL